MAEGHLQKLGCGAARGRSKLSHLDWAALADAAAHKQPPSQLWVLRIAAPHLPCHAARVVKLTFERSIHASTHNICPYLPRIACDMRSLVALKGTAARGAEKAIAVKTFQWILQVSDSPRILKVQRLTMRLA